MHARLMPFRHKFIYRVFSLFVDLDELETLDRKCRLFSHNRRNVFSLYDEDHARRDGGPIRPWIENLLRNAHVDIEGGSIRILCFPRVFGYVFNPLTVYFCHEASGVLRALVYEVRNTFDEKHAYVVPVDHRQNQLTPIKHGRAKQFYVSPFIGMAAHYNFRVTEPGDRLAVMIRETTDDGTLLIATQNGRRQTFDDRNLTIAFLKYPLMTLKVILAIHWQALKLWLKGAKPVPRPSPPSNEATY